jgi:hypothetical protein
MIILGYPWSFFYADLITTESFLHIPNPFSISLGMKTMPIIFMSKAVHIYQQTMKETNWRSLRQKEYHPHAFWLHLAWRYLVWLKLDGNFICLHVGRGPARQFLVWENQDGAQYEASKTRSIESAVSKHVLVCSSSWCLPTLLSNILCGYFINYWEVSQEI